MESLEQYSEYIEFAKNHYLLTIGWLICLGYVIWTQIIILKDRIGFIDFAKATLDINHNGGVFIDIRKPEEFKAGHIHGALDIDPEMLLSGNFSRITCNKDAKIVVVSHTNDDTQAYNCAKALKKSGYQNTFLLRGGMLDLQSSNIPLSKK